jgi:Xaa-Pro aminopeptidase
MRDLLSVAKAGQAAGIQSELGLDAWLVFVRETDEIADPALRLVFRGNVVWPAALLYTRDGHRTAIVGRFDADGLPPGLFDRVIPYDQGIGEPLRDELRRLDPEAIAINVSKHDVVADGLTAGMREVLEEALSGTVYRDRLVSSEGLLARLRGRKLPEEMTRIRRAVEITESILSDALEKTTIGETELSIYRRFHEEMASRGVTSAWAAAHNPAVDAGPDKQIGHVGPTENRVRKGHLLHVDFGVRCEGYCSDLQRMVFFGRRDAVPSEVTRAFDAVAGAIREASHALRPGIRGRDVDAVARQYVVDRGYPEYMHGLGHQIGQSAHDGGVLLGPPWERYGKSVEGLVEEGNVFTLELHVPTAGYGSVSLEEDVLVTASGCTFLSKPQTELLCVSVD